MSSQQRLGIVVPSSNTVVEPLAAEMLAGTNVTAHFSRIRVHDVALHHSSQAQFALDRYRDAVALLADADVDAIVWGGTSASWLGIHHDRSFGDACVAQTGIPTTTCVLAMEDLMSSFGSCKFGLVTPYTSDVHERIIANIEALGHHCTAAEHFGGAFSADFARIESADIASMARRAAASRPDVVLIMCTNLRGASVAAELSDHLGIPVIDSAAVTITAGLDLLERGT